MLLSLHKAAKLRGYPYPALLQAVRDERVPVVKIEGRRKPLIDLEDLDSFIAASKTASKGKEEPVQMPLNKERPNIALKRGKVIKGDWYERYTRNRTALS